MTDYAKNKRNAIAKRLSNGELLLCSAELTDEASRRWRKSIVHTENMRCSSNAKYFIDGKRYCGKHGPAVALQILLSRGDAELVISPTQIASGLIEEVIRLREENARLRSGSVAERKPGE